LNDCLLKEKVGENESHKREIEELSKEKESDLKLEEDQFINFIFYSK
jgi:hypothetical protein